MINIRDSVHNIINRLSAHGGRSMKMYRNTAVMLLIRGVSILLTLISAPIMLNNVDRADYGVLLTLTSIVGWIGYMDIGLGNGLRNKLTEYLAANDIVKAKSAVSSSYAALLLYISIIIILILSVSPHVNWIKFLNTPDSNPNEIYKLANVVFLAFCGQFLFGLINSILFAYQIPAYQSLFTFLGQFLAFIALIVQVYVFDIHSVLQIGAVNVLIPPIVLLLGSIFLFNGRLKEVAPSIKAIDLASINGILSLGVKFFVLQIISIVLFQANSIILARIVGPESVVEYNLAFKLISVLTIVFNIIVTPIWSATSDAYVRKDFKWIKQTLSYVLKVCLATIVAGGVLVLFSKPLYRLWLGDNSSAIHFSTTFLIYIYMSFEMLYKVYGTIINGIGKVYAQMIITGIIAIIYIPLAILLGRIYGISGVLVANCLSFFLNFLWSKIQCSKLLNRTATGIWIK